jgi:hypothetical protein
MRDIEGKWDGLAARKIDGSLKMTLRQRIDHMRGLSAQLTPAPTRVAYAASGILPAAVILQDSSVLVEHGAYWAPARSLGEARYLCAILNSEAARYLLHDSQPKGQGGARHFDNLIWELPIPEYHGSNALHRELKVAAEAAEIVAAAVAVTGMAHFTRQRRAIRDALIADGVAAKIDILVTRLLNGE